MVFYGGEILMKTTSFLFLFLLFIYIKPHFYYYSYSIARITDLLGIVLLFVLVCYYNKLVIINISILKYLITSFGFLSIVLISLSYALTQQLVVLQDFVDIIRPLTIILSIFVGVILYRNGFGKERFINFLIILGLIATLVAFLEKAGMNIFYQLYSDNNHMIGNRATGIYYDFAEFGALQNMGIVAAVVKLIQTKNKINLLYIFIFVVSILLSESKASILLSVIVFGLLFLSAILNKNIYKPQYILFFIIGVILIAYFSYKYIENNPALYDGFEAIFTMSESNASVGNRLNNVEHVTNLFFKYDIRSFIGYSASREILGSYIEIAFFSILFRYGVIGVILYYLIFIMFLLEKLPKPYHYFKYVVFATLVIDLMAAMTTRFSYPIAVFVLLGILLSERYFLLRKISTN